MIEKVEVAIIGAGPGGLYAANKLAQAGVQNIVIYDLRVGVYTRPGHLTRDTFKEAETGLGKKLWKDDYGHIKNLERILFQEIQIQGIRIERKNFVAFHQDLIKPGIIVADADGNETLIKASLVLDCTGSKRSVVQAVNAIYSNSPFILETVTEAVIPNHFMAYVKMNEETLTKITQISLGNPHAYLQNISPSDYVTSILALRKSGWQEFTFPRCYGVDFAKGKACLYLQAPHGLLPENYDKWVQTVLKCYDPSARYEHLPPSQKYTSVPRFLPFTTKLQALRQVAFKGDNLPLVIALGDAQIDPYYFLGNGIKNGLPRINALINCMQIQDGQVLSINTDKYEKKISSNLLQHRAALIAKNEETKSLLRKGLMEGEEKCAEYTQCLAMDSAGSQDSDTLYECLDLYKEILHRINLDSASTAFDRYHVDHKLLFNCFPIEFLLQKMEKIHEDLISAMQGSDFFQRNESINLTKNLSNSWKDMGDYLYGNKQYTAALYAYGKAKELLVCLSLHRCSDDINCVFNLEEFLKETTEEDLVVIGIKAAVARIDEIRTLNQPEEAFSIYQKTIRFFEDNQEKLKTVDVQQIRALLQTVSGKCHSNVQILKLEGLFADRNVNPQNKADPTFVYN